MKKILLSALTACSLMSAHAALLQYSVSLDGPSESPANASPGIGSGTVNYDDSAHTLQLQVSFSGLTGTTTASHIHAPTASPFSGTAGVATTTPSFAGFPLGVTSGSYSDTLDLTAASSYNPAFITANGGTPAGAESALAAAMAGGQGLGNQHTITFRGGQKRGSCVRVCFTSSVWLRGLC